MKAPNVLFINKEGMATFWFMLGAAAVIWSAVYVLRQSITAGLRPQFIIMTNDDVLPMVPERDPERMREIHLEQTRVVMDSIFNKSPNGLDSPDRCRKMLSDDAWSSVKDLLDSQSDAFRDGHIHQKVEIETITLRKPPAALGDAMIASVHGQLIRTGILGNKLYNEVWDVRAEMVWVRNPSLRTSGRIPTLCDRFQSREKPLQSTIRRTLPEDSTTAPKDETATPPKGTASVAGPSN